MKKRLASIIMMLCIFIMNLFMVACDNESEDNSSSESITAGNSITGEMTFKDALTKEGTHIWYSIKAPEGRLTEVDGIYVIESGKMTVYDTDGIPSYLEPNLGTLEDYYSLSDNEAISLAKQKYNAVWESYYSRIEEDIASVENGVLDNLDEGFFEPEVQKEALYETYEKIKTNGVPERNPENYSFLLTLDESGNNTDKEAFLTTVNKAGTYEGHISESNIEGYNYYEYHDGERVEIYVAETSGCEPFEVYDTYYGGYTNEGNFYFVTKCDPDSLFVLDSPGTEGIETVPNL